MSHRLLAVTKILKSNHVVSVVEFLSKGYKFYIPNSRVVTTFHIQESLFLCSFTNYLQEIPNLISFKTSLFTVICSLLPR
jgi:hypothetical protein